MKLVCYLFDAAALGSSVAQISRINNRLTIERLAFVYRKGLDAESIVQQLASNCPGIMWEIYPYAGNCWEFGAYQYGIDLIVRDGDDLIVLNDTVGRNYPFFNDEFEKFTQQVSVASISIAPLMVGKVETAGINFQLFDCEFDCWIRSNLFYLNASALDVIGRRVLDDSVFFAPRVNGESFSLGLQASYTLESYLAQWISPDPAHRGWVAHSGRSSVTDAVRRDKTGSILSEKYLSARILRAGGQLLNFVPDGQTTIYRAKVRWFLRIRKYWNLILRSLRRM